MQRQFDFDKYPNKAGHRNIRTSVESAEQINPQLRRLHKIVILELEKVFPKLYGKKAKQKNKTPEEYLRLYREGRDK